MNGERKRDGWRERKMKLALAREAKRQANRNAWRTPEARRALATRATRARWARIRQAQRSKPDNTGQT